LQVKSQIKTVTACFQKVYTPYPLGGHLPTISHLEIDTSVLSQDQGHRE